MNPASTLTLVARESRRLAVSLVGFCLFFVMVSWLGLVLNHQIQSTNQMASSLAQQMRYWVQTGDEFQIRRSAGALVDSGLFSAVIVLGPNREMIASVPSKSPPSVDWEPRNHFSLRGWRPFYWACAPGITAAGAAWGTICLASLPTPGATFAILILLASGLALAIILWARGVRRLSKSLTSPMLELRHRILEFGTSNVHRTQDVSLGTVEAEEVYSTFLEAWRKQSALELTQRKLEAASALGEIAEQVAHDVKSPLAALRVIRADTEDLSGSTRDLLESAIDRIQGIVSQIQSASRRKAQEADRTRIVDLIIATREIIEEKRLRYRQREDIEFRLDAQQVACLAHADPLEVQRSISNLIDNAVEALPTGGLVRIRVENQEHHVSIVVSDNGHGIAPEILSRLGLERGLTNKPGGSGFGLHHAFTSMRAFGGEVRIRSKIGSGTDVELCFPPLSVHPAAARPTPRTTHSSELTPPTTPL